MWLKNTKLHRGLESLFYRMALDWAPKWCLLGQRDCSYYCIYIITMRYYIPDRVVIILSLPALSWLQAPTLGSVIHSHSFGERLPKGSAEEVTQQRNR